MILAGMPHLDYAGVENQDGSVVAETVRPSGDTESTNTP